MISEEKKSIKSHLFLKGVHDCIPTVLGYLSIGFACGVVSKSCGMTVLQIMGMSVLIYAGSSQFIAAGMIMSHVAASNIIFTIFLVNVRYFLMSASLAPYFAKNSTIKNFISGILLTDETFALAASEGAEKNKINYIWMLGLNITAYLNWIAATVLGALLGSLIYDYEALALDFALSAMFIGLLISNIQESEKKKNCMIIVCSTIISLLLLIHFMSANTAIIIAAVIGALVGVVMDR